MAAGQVNMAAGQVNMAAGQVNMAAGQMNIAASQMNTAAGQVNMACARAAQTPQEAILGDFWVSLGSPLGSPVHFGTFRFLWCSLWAPMGSVPVLALSLRQCCIATMGYSLDYW